MPVLLIIRTQGDPTELERSYNAEKAMLAGMPGRGKDWGMSLSILHHVCAFSDDVMYYLDVFKDEATLNNVLFTPEKLPSHLRPAKPATPSMWSQLGIPRPQDRWEQDVQVLRIGKILPPLQAVVCEEGGERRRGA